MKKHFVLLTILAVLTVVPAEAAPRPITIAQNGQSAYSIARRESTQPSSAISNGFTPQLMNDCHAYRSAFRSERCDTVV